MTHIVVTGSGGFIGRHVTALLDFEPGVTYAALTRACTPSTFSAELARADAVIHLAGVNRPSDDLEFTTGNVDLTRDVAAALTAADRNATLVISSSVRAGESTAYGASKASAEGIVREYGSRTGARTVVFRLPNVFGKWSRPFYNSAVATFCHSVARGLPVDVHDPARSVALVYVEDVARALIDAALRGVDGDPVVRPHYERTLGEIVSLLQQFRALRTELVLPDLSDDFIQRLYTTYVSFLPSDQLGYDLHQYADERGSLAELLKSPWFGQVFVSRTRPGITRGNHFHQTKTEKFVVVEGEAIVRLREYGRDEVTEVPVRGSDFRVIDIPPGHAHNITNVGSGDLVTLFWSSEIFDRERPDTFPLQVQAPA